MLTASATSSRARRKAAPIVFSEEANVTGDGNSGTMVGVAEGDDEDGRVFDWDKDSASSAKW